MAMQFISRSEFQEGLNDLYGKMTRYIDIRLDAFGIRLDSTNTRIDRLEAAQSQMQRDITQMQRDISSIAVFQKAMMDASKAQTEDLLLVVRTLHAEAMEGINELRQRGQ